MKKSIWIRTAVIFLMVTVTVFAAVFFYLYHASEKAITNEIIENSEQNMSFIISGIDQSLQTMTSSMNAFLSDREEIFGGRDEMSAYCRRMTDAFQSFGEFFVIEEDWVYYTKNHLYVLPSSIQKYSAMARSNRSVITEPYYSAPLAYRAIAMIRSVQNPETKAQRLFVGEMSTAKLFETYASIDMDKRTLVVLNDSGKTVYFQPMSKQIRKTAGEDGLLDIEPGFRSILFSLPAGVNEVEIDGIDTIIHKKYHVNTHWHVYELVRAEDFYESMNRIRLHFAIIGILGAVVIMSTAALVSYFTQKPVLRMASIMDQIKDDTLVLTHKDASREDEVGLLWRSFSRMMERLKENHEQGMKMEKEKSMLEYKALQSQIKPHFLFNVHLCIRSMLECGKTQEAAGMMKNLDALLRASMDSREFITLKEELGLMECYLNMQLSRMGNLFDYYVQCDVDPETITLPKLLLQPVLENALKHGVSDLDGNGEISVVIGEKNDAIVICISDNGRGIPPEVLEKIKNGTEVSKGGMVSIGLKNIEDRIHLYYGEDCGIEIASKPGFGTTVKMTIRK